MTILNLFLRRNRYSGGLNLVVLMIIIPMSVMGYLLYSEIDSNERDLKNERRGLNYIASVRPLLQLVQQHRGMSVAYLKGDKSFLKK